MEDEIAAGGVIGATYGDWRYDVVGEIFETGELVDDDAQKVAGAGGGDRFSVAANHRGCYPV